MQEKTENVVGIYHSGCVDGTTSAAVLTKKFPSAKTFPLRHRYLPDDLKPIVEAASGAEHVYTLDCALGVQELLVAGHKVTVIDHHMSGKEEMEALAKENNRLTYVFDNEKSGASLAWTHFFPEKDLPEVVALVEDSDLWKWQFGEKTKNINNYLWLFINKPESIVSLLDGISEDVREHAALISKFVNTIVEACTKVDPVKIQIGEYTVPMFNIPAVNSDFQSLCGNVLSEKLDSAVGMFNINGDQVHLSFRSKDQHEPSSLELAKLLGGGGHRNASGAQVGLQEFFKMLTT